MQASLWGPLIAAMEDPPQNIISNSNFSGHLRTIDNGYGSHYVMTNNG